jgi:hypothetical protein
MLSLVVIGIAFARPALAHAPSSQGEVLSASTRGHGEQLTMDLVRLATQYQLAAAGHRSPIEQRLLAAARRREQHLLSLVESNPGEVLRLAVPSRIHAALPMSVLAHVEQEVDVDGAFEVLHADDDLGGGDYVYHLRTTVGRLSLHFASGAPGVPTDTDVRIRGVRLRNAVALEGSSSVVPVITVPSNTFGEQRVLVIPVYFTDKTQAVYDYADIMQKVDAYYRGNTYQRAWLTSTITQAFLIPMTSTVCDYWKVASLARSAAQAAGYDLTKYNRHVFAHPRTACSWSGLGTVGGNPSGAWLNGIFPQSTVGHELGHNFGAYHSHSLACAGSTCTTSEYGDGYDIMGTSSSLGHFNAFQKERLGWLNYPPQDTPPVLTVYGGGQYALDVYEPAGTSPKALKVLKSTDSATGKKTWYFAESRSSSKVLLHSGADASGDSSYLWDVAPDASTIDWVLDVGQVYSDPAAAVTFTVLAAGSTGATVRVDFGAAPCVPANPVQALSPVDAQWVSRGAAASYGVTVTNKDTTSCPASTFDLQAAAPTGWAAIFDISSVTLAPGASVDASLSVYPPPDAVAGFYSLPVTAANHAEPSYAATSLGTIVLVDSLAVGVSFDKNPPVYRRNQTVRISTAVTAPTGTADAAGVAVTLTIQKPTTKGDGVVTVTGTTDASGKFVYSLRMKPNDPTGTWTVNAAASKNGVVGAAFATFAVQ